MNRAWAAEVPAVSPFIGYIARPAYFAEAAPICGLRNAGGLVRRFREGRLQPPGQKMVARGEVRGRVAGAGAGAGAEIADHRVVGVAGHHHPRSPRKRPMQRHFSPSGRSGEATAAMSVMTLQCPN
jgi:hypothetical protein